jgi:hypothetical protein
MKQNPDDYDDFFANHYLPESRQKEIRNEIMDEHNLNKHERSSVVWTTCLNYGPRGHEKP